MPLWDLEPHIVHVTDSTSGAGEPIEAGVIHHLGELRDEDTVERNGVRLTSPARTAMDCASLLDVERAIALVSDFVQRG